MTPGTLKKALAALIASPLVVGLATLPDPYGKIAASLIAAIGVYVNWGHTADTGSGTVTVPKEPTP